MRLRYWQSDVSDAAIPVSDEILRWSGICYVQEAGHVNIVTTDVSDAAVPISEEILRWSGICYLQEAGHVNIVTTYFSDAAIPISEEILGYPAFVTSRAENINNRCL